MHPSQLAKKGTEHGNQAAVFSWANVAHRYGVTLADEWAYSAPGSVILPIMAADAPPLGPVALKWLHAIPNGGSRGDTAQSRRIAGGQMKAEGVKPGVPDMFLPWPTKRYAGMYIEMKVGDGELSEKQGEFLTFAANAGYNCVVCWNWQDAVNAIVKYLYTD